MDILSANYEDDAPQEFWENKLEPGIPVTTRLQNTNQHQLSTPSVFEHVENFSYLINGWKVAATPPRWWTGICTFPTAKVKYTIPCTTTNGGNR
jgi:hypothetical protein